MIAVVCLDDRNGICFNKRRQSSDRVLCEKLVAVVGNGQLRMNNYSAALFSDCTDKFVVDEKFWEHTKKDDYCFFEDGTVNEIAATAKQILVFRWNRQYPADTWFLQDHLCNRCMLHTEDFSGSSHERITLEVYQ